MLNLKVGDKVKIKSRSDLEGRVNTIMSIDLFSDRARVDSFPATSNSKQHSNQNVSEVVSLYDLVLA